GADLAPLVPVSAPKSPQRGAATARVLSSPERQGATRQVAWPKRRWVRVAVLLVLLAVAGAVIFAMKRPTNDSIVATDDPVVVAMDTTAPMGVYDADNIAIGASNAEEIQRALQDLFPQSSLHPVRLSAGWDRENYVIS